MTENNNPIVQDCLDGYTYCLPEQIKYAIISLRQLKICLNENMQLKYQVLHISNIYRKG